MGDELLTQSPGRVLRVLVTDDHPDTAETLAVLLESSGHAVRVACSGAQAVELAAAFRPHVVILDLNMPDLNGFEALDAMKQRAWSAEVVYVAHTAFDVATVPTLRQAGFQHCARKPADYSEFEQILAPIPTAP